MLALLITGGVLGAVAPVAALLRWAARPALAAYRRGWTAGVQHGQAQIRQEDQAAERMARERAWPHLIVIRSIPARRGSSTPSRVSCAARGNARQRGVRRCAAGAPDHNGGPRR